MYDDIMCRIEELVGDLYHEGYESGWNHCASQATHDYTDEWCDGFLTAWNAIAHEGTFANLRRNTLSSSRFNRAAISSAVLLTFTFAAFSSTSILYICPGMESYTRSH